MKILIRLFFVVLAVWTMFTLAGCSGASYGVSSYHGSSWNYGRYDYYDDRRDRYVDNRNRVARRNYYHLRTNPGRNRSMGHSRRR
jgi:hypothetical protein